MAAFYHTYDFVGDQTVGIVRPNERLIELLTSRKPSARASVLTGSTRVVDASLVPMITPPKPWLSIREGGYLATPVNLMRCGDDAFQHLALLNDVMQAGGLKDVCNALDYLSSCPWRINTKVFDVLVPLYQSEQEYSDLDIPPLNVAVPQKPADYTSVNPDKKPKEKKEERKERRKKRQERKERGKKRKRKTEKSPSQSHALLLAGRMRKASATFWPSFVRQRKS